MSYSASRPVQAPPKVDDELHIRLFQTDALLLRAGIWNAQNVLSPYWRLYQNQNDGAFLRLSSGEDYPLCAARVYFVPAGVPFSCGSHTDFVHFYVHFDVLGLPFLTMRALFDGPVALPPNADYESRVAELGERLQNHREPIGLAPHLAVKAVVYEGLARFLDALSPEAKEKGVRTTQKLEPVAPAVEYIEAHLSGVLRVETLAALCCLSPDYFAKRFRDCAGQTPGAYITHRRVLLATQKLLFTSDSLEKIADDCGLNNRFYLTRVFGRATGVFPAAYRKTGTNYYHLCVSNPRRTNPVTSR